MKKLTKTQRDNALKSYRQLEDWNATLQGEIDEIQAKPREHWTDSVHIDSKRQKINRNRVEMAKLTLELGGTIPARRKTRPDCGETAKERREREREERAAERAYRDYCAHTEALHGALAGLGFEPLPERPMNWWLKKVTSATTMERHVVQGPRQRDGNREFSVELRVTEHTADPVQHARETEAYNQAVREWHRRADQLLADHEAGKRPLSDLELEAIGEWWPSEIACPVNPVTGEDDQFAFSRVDPSTRQERHCSLPEAIDDDLLDPLGRPNDYQITAQVFTDSDTQRRS